MDAPSIPIFIAGPGESVKAILTTSRSARRAAVPSPLDTPWAEPSAVTRARSGAKPVSSGGSTVAFFVAIVIAVAGASITALAFAAPEHPARAGIPATAVAPPVLALALPIEAAPAPPPAPIVIAAPPAAPRTVARPRKAAGRVGRAAPSSLPSNPY